MEGAPPPKNILLPKRAIEPVLRFQEIYFGEVGRLARALQFGDVGRKVIPRREVYYREDHDADRYQCRDNDTNGVKNIAEHLAWFPIEPLAARQSRTPISPMPRTGRTRTRPACKRQNRLPDPNCRSPARGHFEVCR